MSLKKTIADTPDAPILQKVFGKTLEIIEIVVIVVVAIVIANFFGLG